MKKFEFLGKSLSKAQQRNVTGGEVDPGTGCLSFTACSLTAEGKVYQGFCGYYLGPCLCVTNYGLYEPAGGGSNCLG